jgi:type VII secretion effector (TIGR04197 family)
MNKSVLKKLFSEKEQSVELSEVQIELGLIEDVKKEYNKYSKSQVNGNSKTNAVVDAAKQAIAQYQQAVKDYSLITQQVNYIKKQAVDLGVEVPAVIKQLEQEVNSSIVYMNDRIKKLTVATQVASK